MLKKALQIIGLILLIGFSFFYTDKVVMVVRNQDPLMIKIQEYGSAFDKDSVDAFIEDNNIIPGINACVVDINSSYTNMKKVGSYNSNMIEYKEIKPKISLDKIYDKYIIKGNKDKAEVAIIFRVIESQYIDDILKALSKKNTKASFFIDGKLIEDETKNIYTIVNAGHEIYNLGYENKYDKDLLVWTNNMIENMSYNKSKYCLVTQEKQNVLDICSSNKMYTIKSDLLINYGSTFNDVKPLIEKGSIIIFDINDNTVNELNKTLLFLNSKGYTYNTLSTHLSENGCVNN